MAKPIPIELRFPKLFERRQASECWPWLGKIKEGRYGIVQRDGKDCYAHRAAFELYHRPLVSGEVVRHSCDNPRCVNPAHLLAGSQADNMADMHERGRHRFGESHTNSTLNEALVKDIKSRLQGGEKQASIARDLDLNCRHVGKIARGELWGHVA